MIVKRPVRDTSELADLLVYLRNKPKEYKAKVNCIEPKMDGSLLVTYQEEELVMPEGWPLD